MKEREKKKNNDNEPKQNKETGPLRNDMKRGRFYFEKRQMARLDKKRK